MSASLLLGSAAAADTTDPAQKKAQVDKQVDRLENSLDDTSAALKKAYTAVQQTRARLETAQATLAAAQATEVAAERHHEEMVARLEVAQANEARAASDLETTRTRIAAARQRVAGFAAQMYQEQGLGELSIAMDATSPTELASRLAMADTVMTVQNDALDELATAKAGLVAKENHLRALRDEVSAARDQAKEALDQATAARLRAEQAQADLTALEQQQTQRAATLTEQKARERERLKKARAESRRLEKILEERARKARIRAAKIAAQKRAAEAERQRELAAARARQSSSTPTPTPAPTNSGGFLSYPVNAPTSSEFGYRYHPILHYYRLHAGLDFAAGCGVPVHAAASGQVISAMYAGGAGNQVVLDNGVHRGVSLATVYDHLSRFAVTGGWVSRGQVIGYVGTTGLSTGCHLHFETRENGTPVNPRTWL